MKIVGRGAVDFCYKTYMLKLRIQPMRERILNCSKELFKEHGIKKITIDDIAHKLSISKKTVYEHFDHKEEIADAVMQMIFNEAELAVQSIKLKNNDPIVQIDQVGNWICDIVSKTNPLFLQDAKKYFSSSYRRFQLNLKTGFLKSVSEILDKGKEQCIFRPDFDSFLMSIYLLELFRIGLRSEHFKKDKEIMRQLFIQFRSGIVCHDIKKYV